MREPHRCPAPATSQPRRSQCAWACSSTVGASEGGCIVGCGHPLSQPNSPASAHLCCMPGRGVEFGLGRFQQLMSGSQERLGAFVRPRPGTHPAGRRQRIAVCEVSTKHSTTGVYPADPTTDSEFRIACAISPSLASRDWRPAPDRVPARIWRWFVFEVVSCGLGLSQLASAVDVTAYSCETTSKRETRCKRQGSVRMLRVPEPINW